MQNVNQTDALMKKLVTFIAFALVIFKANAQSNLNGDMNQDGDKNITDVVLLVDEILHGANPHAYLTCPDNRHPHMIDLGLPSGTKWACCNVGASSPGGFGSYYAWGETKEKDVYNEATYQYCSGTDSNGDGRYDYEDIAEAVYQFLGSDIAGTYYDVAHMKWGGCWVMPTNDQIKELINNCTSQWTTMNGINGLLFTSPNGGAIFLPAAGGYFDEGVSEIGTWGYYYSSTQHTSFPESVYALSFNSFNVLSDLNGSAWGKMGGFNIRPVYVESTQKSLSLSTNSVEIYAGETATVDITSGSGTYVVGSTDNDVAKASLSGSTITIRGFSAGSVVVTVVDPAFGSPQLISVTVKGPKVYLSCPDDNHPHMIDLGLPSGTKWACCNVGADIPEASGGYYAWGETEEKSTYNWSTYTLCNGTWRTCQDIGSDIAGTQYDVAHVKWGESWAIPSYEQLHELFDNCHFTKFVMYGVVGIQFTGPNGNTVYMPATGYRVGEELKEADSEGDYWTSTRHQSSVSQACYYRIHSYSSVGSGNTGDRCDGLMIRPVWVP